MGKRGDDITTSKLLTLVRGADSFEQAMDYRDRVSEPVFHDTLFEMMQARGLTPKEMIRRSGIERSYFYHILNGQKTPGRNMVLRIGFCMQASLQEMNQLLRLAGLSGLYVKIRRDATLIYAVQHRFTMDQANRLLRQAGEAPLYLEEKDG